MRLSLFALLLPLMLHAQDERVAVSPNGQLEIRLFAAQPEGALWSRVGYQVFLRGKPLLATSWMGLDIRDQEPFLGENPGFMSSDVHAGTGYNSVVSHYMQNGSLGRRLDVEIRAYNDGVAFRYYIPRSTPIEDILIRDEMTEFNFAQPGALSHLEARPDYDVPFVVEEPGVGPVVIAEAGSESNSVTYPRTYLVRTDRGLRTSLSRSRTDPTVAFNGVTPLVWPWRVLIIGLDRAHLAQSDTMKNLNR